MSYDHWKTTEPDDDSPWQECVGCGFRGHLETMWRLEGEWYCLECVNAAEDELFDSEDCEADDE